ncbi:hypothetical protein PINS_up007437 [Pythium insidiosum]|nr:hypothetical protein PINS_up007437 [Pythium insidiosum]
MKKREGSVRRSSSFVSTEDDAVEANGATVMAKAKPVARSLSQEFSDDALRGDPESVSAQYNSWAASLEEKMRNLESVGGQQD